MGRAAGAQFAGNQSDDCNKLCSALDGKHVLWLHAEHCKAACMDAWMHVTSNPYMHQQQENLKLSSAAHAAAWCLPSPPCQVSFENTLKTGVLPVMHFMHARRCEQGRSKHATVA